MNSKLSTWICQSTICNKATYPLQPWNLLSEALHREKAISKKTAAKKKERTINWGESKPRSACAGKVMMIPIGMAKVRTLLIGS